MSESKRIAEVITEVLDRFKAEWVGVDPVWKPLYLAVPEQWLDGFMYMSQGNAMIVVPHEGGATYDAATLYHYKHGITRRYLTLDGCGRAYLHRNGLYVRVPAQEAFDHVYENIESMGHTRATAYSPEFIQARNEALAKAGYLVAG